MIVHGKKPEDELDDKPEPVSFIKEDDIYVIQEESYVVEESPNEDTHTEAVDSPAIYDRCEDEFEPIHLLGHSLSKPPSSNSIVEYEQTMSITENIPQTSLTQEYNTQPLWDEYDDELEDEWQLEADIFLEQQIPSKHHIQISDVKWGEEDDEDVIAAQLIQEPLLAELCMEQQDQTEEIAHIDDVVPKPVGYK